MGAYLSEPNLNKDSLDDGDEEITYGASSMQGWRLEQEDAHNSIIDFDKNTSFFAVYDGHGGHEVAAYCAKYLPNFLKTLDEYEKNDLEAALKKMFLKFDEMLLREETLKELAHIRDPESEEDDSDQKPESENKSEKNQDQSDSESSDNNILTLTEVKSSTKPDSTTTVDCDNIASEAANLYDEACMPLEDVLKRYSNTEKKMKKVLNKNGLKGANSAHLSPMISAPGSSEARKSRLKKKSTAELDKQEEIDISDIKKYGHGELNGAGGTEEAIDFDEASNLCDLTEDSQQKELDNPDKESQNATTKLTTPEASPTKNHNHQTTTTDNTADSTTPETKHRIKMREEEIKLSPIRNKSLSSSSVCDEGASTQKDDTLTSETTETGNNLNGQSSEGSSDIDATSNSLIDEENKENDFNNSGSVGDEKGKSVECDESETVTSTINGKARRGSSKKESNNLIAKLIAGVINKKLRSGTRASKETASSETATSLMKDTSTEIDEDDEFDHNYEVADEQSGDESGESGEDSEDDDDDDSYDESSDDEAGDMEPEDESDDYPVPGAAPKPGFDSGCTAVVAVLRENKLYVANAGDSRCIVCRDGKAIEMSYDHKPEDEAERERVEKAGGQVTKDGRINNGLNLSRAIGDHTYKRNKDLPLSEQMITSLPDVLTLDIDREKDKFMVLACDGIWNFMSSQDVCDYIQERMDAKYTKLSQICEELFMHCLAPNSEGDGTGCDNMTCVLVTFAPFQKFELKVDKNCLKRGLTENLTDANDTKKQKQEDTIV